MVTQISVRPSYTQVTSYSQWQTESPTVPHFGDLS